MSKPPPRARGRGVRHDPANRFDRIEVVPDPDAGPDERPALRTVFLRDASRTILTENHSPDLPFDLSLNPYRGCEHGCAYCYARPYHEYLGFSPGLDFETKVVVKRGAPGLLREALSRPGYQPRTVALSGATDPYQPAERSERITRGCLEVLAEFRHPVSLITKNALVLRDLDLLAQLAEHRAVRVMLSVTTLDDALRRDLEPRTSSPRQRLAAIAALAEAGVPVGCLVSPVIPGLTDHEVPAILEAVAEAGADAASFQLMRLPGAVAPIFERWLHENRPERAERVLGRQRATRGGDLSDARFGRRFRGEGAFADTVSRLFELHARRLGLARRGPPLNCGAFQDPAGTQGRLFPV